MSASNLHLQLERRLSIECTIQQRENLHVGAGRGEVALAVADLPIQRDGKGKALVPGSSIRGAFRAQLHRLLNSLDASTRKSLIEDEEVFTPDEEERAFAAADEKEKAQLFSKRGIVNRLFGFSGFASPLRFTDARLENGGSTRRRVHIAIDLDTDRVRDGGLFDLEAVTEPSTFSFAMIFDELKDKSMRTANRVFYTWLRAFASEEGGELFLGGWKSRGYGYCTVKVVRVVEQTPRQMLLGQKKPYEGSEVQDFLATRLKQLEGKA